MQVERALQHTAIVDMKPSSSTSKGLPEQVSKLSDVPEKVSPGNLACRWESYIRRHPPEAVEAERSRDRRKGDDLLLVYLCPRAERSAAPAGTLVMKMMNPEAVEGPV